MIQLLLAVLQFLMHHQDILMLCDVIQLLHRNDNILNDYQHGDFESEPEYKNKFIEFKLIIKN